jgi:hypothetical protein
MGINIESDFKDMRFSVTSVTSVTTWRGGRFWLHFSVTSVRTLTVADSGCISASPAFAFWRR